MSGDLDKCDIEAPRKKVETEATFPGARNVRQRPYDSLIIREDRDACERNTVDGYPLSSMVDDFYFHLKHGYNSKSPWCSR